MKINHLMIGCRDVEKSVIFYSELFGFIKTNDDPGALGGAVLEGECCHILLIPFSDSMLPNPKHFAFEVGDDGEFDEIFSRATNMGLEPRSWPAKNSAPGVGELCRGDTVYRIFYFSDPNAGILEVMTKRKS